MAILGAGTIGESLLRGLLSGGWREPSELVVTVRDEQRVEVLRLDGNHDQRGSRDGLGVRGGRLDAVALPQLGCPLVVVDGDDDLGGLAPAAAEETAQE